MSDEIHTCLPGKIIAWDGERATVQPALPKKLANGTSLNAPSIVSVPVCFPVGDNGHALISVPLKAGDAVMLNFSERSLENWLSGSDTAPDDPRRYDLSDCFATPAVRPMVGKADTDNLSLMYNGGSIKIAPSGAITLTAGQITINGATTINGVTKIKGDVATTGALHNNGTNVGSSHTHGGILRGGAHTDTPS